MNKTKKNLLVLYPYPIGKFIYQLYEFEKLSQYFNLIIYDLSELVSPGFSKFKNEHRSENNSIFEIKKWTYLFKNLINLIKQENLVILYELRNEKINEFIIRFLIRIYRKKYNVRIYCYAGGISPEDSNIKIKKNIYLKFIHYIKLISCYEELLAILRRRFNRAICQIVALKFDYILAAGEEWKKIYSTINKKSKIIDSHSHDFNRYLAGISNTSNSNFNLTNQAIFLDSGSPIFQGDYQHIKTKPVFTKENWCPALCKFFKACEVNLNLSIKIAGHYKTEHEKFPDYFGYNEVIYGKTNELIKNATLVIALTSTAVSYAVAYRKPVVLIYNNELLREYRTMGVIQGMADSLGCKLLNIDDQYCKFDFKDLLNVNHILYEKYEKLYLSSNRNSALNANIVNSLMG